MVAFRRTVGLIVASLVGLAAADAALTCGCYTATVTAKPNAAMNCPMLKCGPRPMCIQLKETTIPGPNFACPNTPTVTAAATCTTTCQRGCGTSIKTVTADSPCVAPGPPSNPSFPTPPAPIVKNPTGSSSTGCYTHIAVPSPSYCPGWKPSPCPHANCIMLKTTTLPAVDPACPTTPTVTATPSCLNQCSVGCGTSWKTVTAEA